MPFYVMGHALFWIYIKVANTRGVITNMEIIVFGSVLIKQR
jgi:hypothetical protein